LPGATVPRPTTSARACALPRPVRKLKASATSWARCTAANHSAVSILGWQVVGNYALRFDFSDGHRTGIYSFEYLRQLAANPHRA